MHDPDFENTVKKILESEIWKKSGPRFVYTSLFYREDGSDGIQNIHTPFPLCKEMITRLSEFTGIHNKSILVLFNLEFVDVLVTEFGVPGKNITFIGDTKRELLAAQKWYDTKIDGLIEINGKEIIMPETVKKFDVVVMNPPYQAPHNRDEDQGRGKTGTTLWDKFVEKSFGLVVDKGFVCAVHPSGWREASGTFNGVRELICKNQAHYLELHDRADGVKTFGAQSSYDWYVIQKTKNVLPTKVRQLDGYKESIRLADMPMIPNFDIKKIINLCAKENEPKVEVLRSESAYEIRKPWMNDNKTLKFCHPCVYTITKDNEVSFKWSKHTDNGHFGVPKVIFSNGTSGTICDTEGKYGLTQFSYAIVDEPQNLENIQKAIASPEFLKIMDACSLIGKHRYNRKAISCFRKDFWKDFL